MTIWMILVLTCTQYPLRNKQTHCTISYEAIFDSENKCKAYLSEQNKMNLLEDRVCEKRKVDRMIINNF